jgi:CRISPR-associated protein Csd2
MEKKIDYGVVIEVEGANPNGDPLNNNRPRTTIDGRGKMMDVCLKRKIRDRLQEMGFPIFVQSDERCTDGCLSLRERFEKEIGSTKGMSVKQIEKIACEKWFDVRAFGQLFAYSSGKKGSEVEAVSIGIRGPVTIRHANSLQIIEVSSDQITKSVNGEPGGKKHSSDRMGTKYSVDYGIYVAYGSIFPEMAKKTGFSDKDALAIKTVLPRLFENDASSSRPGGSMRVLKVFWWTHDKKDGACSAAKVHGSLIFNGREVGAAKIDGVTVEVIDGF